VTSKTDSRWSSVGVPEIIPVVGSKSKSGLEAKDQIVNCEKLPALVTTRSAAFIPSSKLNSQLQLPPGSVPQTAGPALAPESEPEPVLGVGSGVGVGVGAAATVRLRLTFDRAEISPLVLPPEVFLVAVNV